MEIKTFIILMAIIAMMGAIFISQKPDSILKGFSENAYYASNASTTSSGRWASSTPFAIPRNDNRHFLRISVAPFSSSTLFVHQASSTDLTVANRGISLNASSTATYYQIDSTNLYKGEVQVISAGDTRFFWEEQ